ncbi:MAG: zinc ribbon domain-containing protein [Eubacteriales bacterium]|jgi:hypothetical protein|nr:zinc ribbon domain-containing protein [Eubacteriales bacterium]
MGRKKKSPPPSFATAGTWHTHYVVLFDDLLNSPAYIALSAAAKEAYTILMQEYKGIYTGDKIVCPYSTFTSKGMRTNTVSRALMMLERFGFIRIEEHGGLERRPNVYRLIDGWKSIRTAEEAKEIKKAFENDLRQQKKAKTNITSFLLTGKLFCGTCKTQMIGTSGTSKTGAIHRYYTCANAINRCGSCDRKNIQKDLIEDAVIAACRDALEEDTIEALLSMLPN